LRRKRRPSKRYWKLLAVACAATAYEDRANSQRGLLIAKGEGVLAFYDNVLPNDSMRARDRVARRFRRYLAGAGIRTLAAATYPQHGPDDGRSLAMVLDATESDEPGVSRVWERMVADLAVENEQGEGGQLSDG
jgi:hypothetical protein